jgi:2-polyprenyl-3-methyl-5-hydroxy-6-metoxy-1,4-benzoquinol methylase
MSGGAGRTAHDSWAEFYDQIYEETFDRFYGWLTTQALGTVSGIVKPGSRILDFGAGTGRLAIPLAARGHRVTAVEPSGGMLKVLRRKAANAGWEIDTVEAPMKDFAGDGSFDLALCVFSVIAYVQTDDDLDASFRAAASGLQRGGCLLLDVPNKGVFASNDVKSANVDRKVTVTQRDGDTFTYVEETRVKRDGAWVEVHDRFPIRFWPVRKVRASLAKAGFTVEHDLTSVFSAAGANYWLCRKD